DLNRRVAALDVWRGDEERALHLALGQPRGGLGDGYAAQRVSDEDDGALGQFNGFDDGVDPVLGVWIVKVCLFDTGGRAHLLGPIVLPATGPGFVQARQDQDIAVCDSHSPKTRLKIVSTCLR